MAVVFQNFDVYKAYRRVLYDSIKQKTFDNIYSGYLNDRFLAAHMLMPILEAGHGSFAVGACSVFNRSWAQSKGLADKFTNDDLLRMQIEDSGAEIFYNLDPIRFDGNFLKSLPGNIRFTIAWRAALLGGCDLTGYDLIVCNFPSILKEYQKRGWPVAEFYPAYDPEMSKYIESNRDIDVTFVGTFSQHHVERARLLETVASLSSAYNIALHLSFSRVSRLANTPLGYLPALNKYRVPTAIRLNAKMPCFGVDLYRRLGRSKIVINGAIDMAGKDRGNMRCWEAMGCGALLLSDAGNYPDGMTAGKTMLTYQSVDQVPELVQEALANYGNLRSISQNGNIMLKETYSKAKQWKNFLSLI